MVTGTPVLIFSEVALCAPLTEEWTLPTTETHRFGLLPLPSAEQLDAHLDFNTCLSSETLAHPKLHPPPHPHSSCHRTRDVPEVRTGPVTPPTAVRVPVPLTQC